MQLETKIINNLTDLNKARHLLYAYYVERLKWKIAPNNPSCIKIKTIDDRLAIIDDYDHLATWFSITDGKDILACTRLCRNDLNGYLEIERYSAARHSLKHILNLKQELNMLELNREALSSHYVTDKKALMSLLKVIFNYCLGHHYTLLTTTNITEWANLYDEILFPKLNNCQFKYCDSDPHPVEVYFAKSTDIVQMLHRIDIFIDNKQKQDVEAFYF